jgi:hypothetical protein
MTKDELIARFIERKTSQTKFPWGQVVSAISSIPNDKKSLLVDAINNGQTQSVGEQIINFINLKKKEVATEQVNEMVAGDVIEINELLPLV